MGAVGVNDPVILVSQWNAQCPACVSHFIHEAKKSEGTSLEVTRASDLLAQIQNPHHFRVWTILRINRRYMKKNDTRLQLRLSLKEKEKN